MSIPEGQLNTWAKQGSVTQSKETYRAIKTALEAGGTPYADEETVVFLQGSYANDTNVYGESDVDIVMAVESIFASDLDDLSPQERTRYRDAFSEATYTLQQFKQDVLGVLKDAYVGDVLPGKKAIRINADAGRRNADVLVAAQFRRYTRFNDLPDQRYHKGIFFFLPDGQPHRKLPAPTFRKLH